jgi:hypothetical protein
MGLGSSLATTAFEAAIQLEGLMPALAHLIKLPAAGINLLRPTYQAHRCPCILPAGE